MKRKVILLLVTLFGIPLSILGYFLLVPVSSVNANVNFLVYCLAGKLSTSQKELDVIQEQNRNIETVQNNKLNINKHLFQDKNPSRMSELEYLARSDCLCLANELNKLMGPSEFSTFLENVRIKNKKLFPFFTTESKRAYRRYKPETRHFNSSLAEIYKADLCLVR